MEKSAETRLGQNEREWAQTLATLARKGPASLEARSIALAIGNLDEAGRERVGQDLSRAVEEKIKHRELGWDPKAPPAGPFLGHAAVFLAQTSNDDACLDKALEWMKKGLDYLHWDGGGSKKWIVEDYTTAMFDCLIEKDRPDLFRKWARYAQVDILQPYISACLGGKRKIMEEFVATQPKREGNKALEAAIVKEDWETFCFLIEHSNLRKGDSKILADTATEIAGYEARSQTLRNKGYMKLAERSERRLRFLTKIFPEIARRSDPVMSLYKCSGPAVLRERVEELMLGVMDMKMVSRAAKDPTLHKHFPRIAAWRNRGKLLKSAEKNRAEAPQINSAKGMKM